MAVNDCDATWGRYRAERDRVAKIHAGRDEAVSLIRGMPGWDAETLASIQEGAYFLPMVARTVETFGGLVFLKSPARTFPEGLEALTDDVTQTGQEIDRFAEACFDGVLLTGVVGVLVDYPDAPTGLSRADAEKLGHRPILRMYDGNSILAGPNKIRLLEDYEVQGADEFTFETKPQVRVLDLDEGGNYRQRVFRQDGGAWVVHETLHPQMASQPLKSIPIFFSNSRDNEARPEKPPMLDIADVNIAHLNNSAQQEWALAWLGAPILFGAGIELAEGETIQMGASSGVFSQNHQAKLEIVQADAAKFSGLKTAMDDKRRDAASLGARMLTETPRAAIAAETARIERAGETSVVGAIANAVSQCLTNALRFMAQWAGLPVEVASKDGTKRPILYWLNTDLLPTRMSPQEITSLLDAWQRGALSKKELFSRFQEAEIVDPALSFEDHEEQIASEEVQDDDADIEAAMGGRKPDEEPVA